MSAAHDPSDLRVVGRVVKVHGLRGELVVEPSTDEVEARFAPGSRLRLSDGGFLTVIGARWHSGRLLVAAEEVPDRDAAERLRRATLSAPPSESAPDDPDEFHDHQLEGLRAELADGTVVGTITAVDHGAGGELLVIDRDGSELLVPFVRAIVPTVDVAGGRVVLDPPDGLLDPE
ncbi:ribosome maturation factor RimM [Actinomycetospora sp. CA-084318]|uniref:ribosome maturation factor RimM n=1 Tax=Actinomycetospora sp. CA-084318 TaxID=3239892 RepID=UPI003D96DD71